MATSKLNIFSALHQVSDDEDEGFTKGQFKGAPTKKTGGARDDKGKGPKQGGTTGTSGQGEGKKDDHKKNKGVPAPGSHPLERHSGTGYAAYDKKPKKGGAGKGNWGSNKDQKGEDATREEEGGEKAEEKAPEPTGITLEEYYSKHQSAKNEPQINEAKAKVTSEQLMKEVLSNKATVLPSRKAKEVDDKKVGKKKTNVDVDHHAEVTTEHADLLNFRTGFIEREFRQRSEGEKEGGAPRRDFKKREETKEGETAAPEGEKAEGEKPEAQEGQEQGERKGGRGGYKGDRGDRGDNRGDNRGGDRGKGGRGGYKGSYTAQPKVNIEDDSSFPKLG